ncbi:hypothetical protein Sfulv_62120 [Streptomyces fulvorobeus]|uniref:Uncharacterized protein n=2 Tax=Streptomyces fulvorobeus TaxID=284028 RepID=A0A7J0CG01_9ACTN|nr:hypothetical protein Sfulv_62120 [Streptomyces fulvorobeus]
MKLAPARGRKHSSKGKPMAGKSSASSGKRGRSAITGRFVKQSAVRRSPSTTVNESASKKPKKK